jgi:endogenous inhibitor of DNA gyrase (YacG/DUF329 family)
MESKCPVCRRPVKTTSQGKPEDAKYFPFCSQRCKLVDLGAWLDGRYRIEGGPELHEPEEYTHTIRNRSDTQQ